MVRTPVEKGSTKPTPARGRGACRPHLSECVPDIPACPGHSHGALSAELTEIAMVNPLHADEDLLGHGRGMWPGVF